MFFYFIFGDDGGAVIRYCGAANKNVLLLGASPTAASISSAVVTSMRCTNGGVGSDTGPLIKVTFAPRCAAAAAIAKPILPELWLVI